MKGGKIYLNMGDTHQNNFKVEKKKLIETDEFVKNVNAFVPMKMKIAKKKKKVRIKPTLQEDTMKKALQKGQISHKDLEGIIKSFQAYEKQTIQNTELGIPADTEKQIKARNIITDRTS